MNKILIVLFAMLILSSCNETSPVLNKNEYKILDTTYVSRNGFGATLEYDVIIKIDSSLYAGKLDPNGDLIFVNPRKLKAK